MTIPQKAILCLLITIILFSGISLFVHTGFFEVVENRFHNPAVTGTVFRETANEAKKISGLLSELQERFSSSLNNPSVQRIFLPVQNSTDIYDRSRIFGMMHESVSSLISVRFLDADGIRIHFSTWLPDIAYLDEYSIVYHDYEDTSALPYNSFRFGSDKQPVLILDQQKDEIIFLFPVYSSFELFQGAALFTVSAGALSNAPSAGANSGFSENFILCSNPPGIVGKFSGKTIPWKTKDEAIAGVSGIWSGGFRSLVPFISSGVKFFLVSVWMEQGFYYGRIVNEEIFILSPSSRTIILVSIFLTVFLLIFLFFSLKRKLPDIPRPLPHNIPVPVKSPAKTPPMVKFHEITAEKTKTVPVFSDDIEELEMVIETAVSVEEVKRSGLLAAAEKTCIFRDDESVVINRPDELSKPVNVQLTFGDDGLPYIAQTAGLELVDEDIDETIKSMEIDKPVNPRDDVIVEQDGIPFISNDVLGGSKNTDGKLDGSFEELVDSLINKSK